MNFLEKLKGLGAKFEKQTFDLTTCNNVVLTKDLNAYQETVYILRYKKVPSFMYVEYRKKNFDELLKFLIEKNFNVLYLKSTHSRFTKETVVMVNDENRTTLELSSSDSEDIAISSSSLLAGNQEEDEFASFTICFDASLNPELPYEIKDKFCALDGSEGKGKILLFEKTEYGEIVLTPHQVKNYDLNISENYNDDFLEVDKKLKHWASDFTYSNKKLTLLHGVPGSGKTNYIKYILNNLDNVKKIYIPPYFVQSMADPSFFPVIKKEKNSLLIIEDAEKILINREDSADNSIISILLNLCDGIMADVLNFKIIATFNTDEDKIDSALKRKGRMFLKYKFDSLSEEKTDFLFRKLYDNPPPKKRMTLAEIYNDENEFGAKKEERRIGFGA